MEGFRAFLFFGFCALPVFAQQAGELRLQVVDPAGAGLKAAGTLTGEATQVNRRFATASDGRQALQSLPFGLYRLTVEAPGFQTSSQLIEIRSELPLAHRVTLGIVPIETEVEVGAGDTLLNPGRTGAVQEIGAEQLRDRQSAAPARAILNLVDKQPGWLLEANGVLHPRGSEYGVQYVLDGIPLLDNRSPVFAPTLDVEEFQSLNVRTGGYPAEYGRQLGGVIEVTTARDTRPGFHGRFSSEAGSFATANESLAAQYGRRGDTFGAAAYTALTDRYLDPPVEQNYSNHASATGFSGRWERDWSAADRTRIQVRHSRAGFLVPNEPLQAQAGQRQDRATGETGGQIAYTHLFSPRVLLTAHASARDVSARLWSNALSTPIAPRQERGFREAFASGSVSAHFGAHDFKFGAETLLRSVHEVFGYRILAYRLGGVRIFDRDTPAVFDFSNRRQNREQAAYAQDEIRLGPLTVNAGIRWDDYRLLVHERAASPRIAAAWRVTGAELVLRASYDRAFQTPAIENLLLASSAEAQELNDRGLRLHVRPSHGDFYEAGFSKGLAGHVRLDAAYFRREFRNFADDSVLVNTGISFPIAFSSASIHGFEAKLETPRWGPVSGFISYTNLLGRGRLPITGGLFLEDNAAALLDSTEVFRITQDQRNTIRARVRYQAHPRVWLAWAAQYGSGLPVELEEGFNLSFLEEQYGKRTLERVDFSRGRVRPSFSLDVSAGAELWKREHRNVSVQADLQNLTNRFNAINFAGLFSGTALAPPRSAAVRLQAEF